MKRNLTIAILVLLVSSLLFSCKTGDGQSSTDDVTGQLQAGESLIYDPNSAVQIVYGSEFNSESINKLNDIHYALSLHLEKTLPTIVSDSSEKKAHEIVVGKTNRPISEEAYKKLSRLDKENETDVGYVIYASGGSVAIAYDADKFGINSALQVAVTLLSDEYIAPASTLILKDGVVASNAVDPLVTQKALDDQKREEAYARIEAQIGGELGKEVVAAIREYYSMYSSDVVTWLANLYDPVSGGFYYSNSGRNTHGYGADLETTGQALGFLETSGMIEGSSWGSVIPDEMKAKLVYFAKSLQDPNGYFYHPQWPKDLTDTKLSRRGRDMGHALSILRVCGSAPTYDTPTGVEGDGIKADGSRVDGGVSEASKLTSRLGSSKAAAVSKVVSVADSDYVAPHLVSDITFKEYLATLDIRGNSYAVGNTLTAQSEQFVYRDKQLKEQGKGYSLVAILEEWLLENQNPKNGMWYWVEKGEYGYHLFDGVNGLLKIVDLYNRCGLEFPNALAACESAIESITCDERAVHVCYPYNAWYAVDLLFDNLTYNSKDSSQTAKTISDIRARLIQNAPVSIKRTMEQVSIFKKDDGSFSYTEHASCQTSQGMQVALPNTNEGDVNSTVICVNGVANHMFSVLGLERPPLFGKAELFTFLSVIEELGPIIKDEEPAPEIIDFEDEALWQPLGNPDVPYVVRSSGKVEVVEDPKKAGNNVIELTSYKGGGDQVNVNCKSLNLSANCYTFQADILIDSSTDKAYFAQILLDRAYMLTVTVSGDKVWFGDSSSQSWKTSKDQDLRFSAPLGEWFNLKIEYYPGDHETVRIKIYVDNKLMAVSDNYYDSTGKKLTGAGVPSSYFTYSQFLVMSDYNAKVLMDNVVSYKSNLQYTPALDINNQPAFNVDPPDKDELIFDFEKQETGKNYPEGITVTESGGSVDIAEITGTNGAVDKALKLSGAKGSGYTLDIPVNLRTKGANCAIISADILVDKSTEVGTVAEIILRRDITAAPSIMRMQFKVVEESGNKYLTLIEAPNGVALDIVDGIKIPLGEEKKLMIKYYRDVLAALIYVDDILLATNTSLCSSVSNLWNVGEVEIVNSASVSSLIYIDNLKVERNIDSFNAAVQPQVGQTVHGFDSSLSEGVVLSGGAEIKDGKLELADTGSAISIPVNERSVILSAFLFEAEITVPKNASDGVKYRIAFKDANGNTVLCYDLITSGDSVGIHEVTEGKAYETPLASFGKGSAVKLGIEYFAEKDTANIYLDGECVAISSLQYSEKNAKNGIKELLISSVEGSADTLFDNIIIESYNKFYEEEKTDGQNKEDGAEKLTFEHSSTGNIPSGITTSLKSTGANLKIVEIFNEVYSKALAFTTLTGAQDAIYFDMANKAAKGNAVVFEADLYIDYNTYKDTFYEIYLTGDNNNFVYLLTVTFKDGTLWLGDISGASSQAVPGRIWGIGVNTGVAEATWFNIKIEYYFGDAETVRAKTYVNNELILVSDNFYGKTAPDNVAVPKTDITQARVSSYTSTDGIVMLDNVSLYKSTLTLKDDELTTSTPTTPETPATPLDKPSIDSSLAAPGKYYEGFGGLGFTGSTGFVSGGSGCQTLDGLVYYNASKGYTFSNAGKNYVILGTDGTNKILTMTRNTSWSDMYFKLQNDKTGNCYVFEADIKLSAVICSKDANGPALFFASNYNASTTAPTRNAARIFVAKATDGAFTHYEFLGQKVEAEKWYTVTVEYYTDTNTVKYYINGVCYDTDTLDTETEMPYFGIFMDNNAVAPTVSLDNVVYVSEEISEEEKEPVPEEPENYYEALGGLNFTNSSGYVTGGSGYQTLDGLVYYNTNKGNTYKKDGSNYTILDTDAGNKHLLMYKHQNVAWSDMYFKKQSDTVGNCIVFETDIKLSSTSVTADKTGIYLFLASSYNNTGTAPTRNAEMAITAKAVDGVFSHYELSDGTRLDADTWYTLTMEYYTDSNIVKYYLNGTCFATINDFEPASEMDYFGAYVSKWEFYSVSIHFDNVVYKAIDKTYTSESETPPAE
ncbi:MAG: hypothetical protein J6D20_05745 [Clostridia bacterium]|nr:hypothetical protein [Clostridia bacterium]